MQQFEKIAQGKFKSKGAIIAEEILRMIKSGEYPGKKLPAERIIAEQMGVSRPSVREAISALHIVGILESRPGDGTYISDLLAIDELSLQVKNLLEESDSPYEIMQARKAVEAGVVRLAIKEATDEDLNLIKANWDNRCKIGLKGDYQAYIKLGKEPHLSIAKATKNSLLISIVDRLLDVTNQPLWQNMRRLYYEKDASHMRQMLDIHNNIVDAIQARNSQKAIHALEADFDAVLEQLYNRKNGKE